MTGKEGEEDATNGHQTEKNSEPKQPDTESHLLFCGSTKWDLLGRKSIPKAVLQRGGSEAGEELLAPTRFRFTDFPDFRPRSVFSGPCASHFIIIGEDGNAYGMGRNDNAQIGQDDLCSRAYPVLLDLPQNSNTPDQQDSVVSAACGRNHTIIVMKSGSAYAAGQNQNGQLGTAETVSDNAKITYCSQWKKVAVPYSEKIISAAAGSDFSLFACESGKVYASGTGQYGLMGNGRTGESIETRNRVVYDSFATPIPVHFDYNQLESYMSSTDAEKAEMDKESIKIKQVAAGTTHALAVDTNGKVWSWGFGGYGRLGHRSPNDELRPKLIETFDAPHYNIDYVNCGATCSFAVQLSRNSTYFWGVTKKSGESNMYPKPMFDLQGNPIHCLASGVTSTVAASERNVVTWGASPTYGELGYGKNTNKSSTKPRIVESVEGLYCKSAAEGCAFTVLVMEVRSNEEDRKILEKLDERNVGTPSDLKATGAQDSKKASASEGKRKGSTTGGGRGKGKKRKR